jgi:sialate O-acetylesterase
VYKSFSVEGGKVRLTFTDAAGLRVRGGGDLKGFAIRGATGDWVWATGKIDGEDIVVWSDQVPAPAAVRYAWAMNPVISVENDAGLPLAPFRTDTGSKQ